MVVELKKGTCFKTFKKLSVSLIFKICGTSFEVTTRDFRFAVDLRFSAKLSFREIKMVKQFRGLRLFWWLHYPINIWIYKLRYFDKVEMEKKSLKQKCSTFDT
jgi:hypothetical protein